MRALACLLFLAGCGSDAPQLLELRCSPSPLSAAPPGPYTLSCDLEFEGKAGDVSWIARGSDGVTWASGSDFIESSQRAAGRFGFTMTSAQAPAAGTLTVSVSVDHVDGIDGPAGDSITTQVDVVP